VNSLEVVDFILALGGIAAALAAIWGIIWGITKWIHKQNNQSTEIADLEKKHDEDTKKLREKEESDFEQLREEERERISRLEEELCVLSYALLAVLDGLKQQGCNGEVTKAHSTLEKYLNQKAHGQK